MADESTIEMDIVIVGGSLECLRLCYEITPVFMAAVNNPDYSAPMLIASAVTAFTYGTMGATGLVMGGTSLVSELSKPTPPKV